jgi:Trk-type K+ transport system membrane component
MINITHGAINFLLDVFHATTESKRIYRRLAVLFLATVVTAATCALLMYLLERKAQGSDINSYGDALFWSTSQLLTLGSALSNPVTTSGRFLAVAMDLYAVVIIGTLSGSLGAYFLHTINLRLKAADASDEIGSSPKPE